MISVTKLLSSMALGSGIFLISNPSVFQLFGKSLLQRLSENGFQVTEILIPDGETHKNLRTVEKIYAELIAHRADRSSTLVALGGGVTGDICWVCGSHILERCPLHSNSDNPALPGR